MELKNKREANYDLLRIISTIAVVVIHVSGIYVDSITNSEFFGKIYEKNIIIPLVYGTLANFAVPCFIMLSGALLLNNNKNEDYLYFYKKTMKNVGVPTLVFSIFYFVYSEMLVCAGVIVKGKELSQILIPIGDLVKGKPYYHMWYLYMIMGIYILVPVILKVKNSVKEDTFNKICIIMFLICSVSGRTSTFGLNWSITKISCYLGYFMIGYQLRKNGMKKQNNKEGILLIVLGLVSETVLALLNYLNIIEIISVENVYLGGGHFNPLVLTASLLIFAGFSKLSIRCDLSKVSAVTLYIYLMHAFVWNLLSRVVRKIGVDVDAGIIIPLMVAGVFVLSYVLSIIYVRLWKEINEKYLLTEKVCKAVGLE